MKIVAWSVFGAVAVLLGQVAVRAGADPETTGSGTSAGTESNESVSAASTTIATDPGPRPGAAGAGCTAAAQPIAFDNGNEQLKASACCYPGLSSTPTVVEPTRGTLQFCEQAVIRFQEIDSVSGNRANNVGSTETGLGLGPTYNANSCATCHSQPAILGAAVGPTSPQFPGTPNPQVALATLDGATNAVPFFVTASGPVREARFKSDNGVHDLFTIAGRPDARGCNATQPNFNAANAQNNLSFRIPLATFGLGLVELVTEEELEANLQVSSSSSLGIAGTFNRSGNDGSITRFGWKAQNKSILMFAGEAYNVEQGVSNELFPEEREGGASSLQGCFGFNTTPEDTTNVAGSGSNTASDISADVVNFAMAVRLSRPPTPQLYPGVSQNTFVEGSNQFVNVGCANCHTPTLQTDGVPLGSSFDPAMSGVVFHPYSDFALHHMGSGLADGISQGNAGPDQFRSTPLWGVGQRLFFLHDGRTTDLTAAIADHASPGSEANTVIANFNNLSESDQQAVVDFLRSL